MNVRLHWVIEIQAKGRLGDRGPGRKARRWKEGSRERTTKFRA